MSTTGPAGPPGNQGGRPRGAGVQAGRAFLVVAVALVIGVAVLARQGPAPRASALVAPTSTTAPPRSRQTTTTAVAPTVAPTTTTTLAPSSVKVLVLNGWTTAHGALFFQTKLKGEGYDTLAPYNATSSSITSSEILFASPRYRANAMAIAGQLLVPTSAVVELTSSNGAPVPPTLVGQASVVVVIGQDISSQVPANYK